MVNIILFTSRSDPLPVVPFLPFFESQIYRYIIFWMLEIIEFRRPTESYKNLYITGIPNDTDENELTVIFPQCSALYMGQ